jgi:hypothetical protein
MVFDGITFFKEFHIRYTESGPNVSRGWVGIPCPFCNDRSDHLGFHLQTSAMSCWKCGRHSALDYVKTVLRIPISEAKIIFSRYLTKNISGLKREKTNYASSIELPSNSFTDNELSYIKKRMMDDSHIKKYDLRSGGLIGDWAYRIVIPIYYNHCLVSATGRTIADVKPKYFTLPKEKSLLNIKHIFFGLDLVENNTVVVVEGPLDAIRGGSGFVSSFGVNMSDEQLLLLKEYDTVIFIKDSDEAGENMVKSAYKLSSLGAKNVEVISITPYKDIGEMPQDEINNIRKELGLV